MTTSGARSCAAPRSCSRENGYDRTSMAEVAYASGVSKALLYHYYIGKENLLFDILHAHLQDLMDAVRAVDPKLVPRARLRALIGARARRLSRRR